MPAPLTRTVTQKHIAKDEVLFTVTCSIETLNLLKPLYLDLSGELGSTTKIEKTFNLKSSSSTAAQLEHRIKMQGPEIAKDMKRVHLRKFTVKLYNSEDVIYEKIDIVKFAEL